MVQTFTKTRKLQMAKCALKISARGANVLITGEEKGKNVTSNVNVFKKDE